MTRFSVCTVIFMLFSSISVIAQPPRSAPTPNDTLQSVRVMDDGRVEFSIYAAKAEEVLIDGDFLSLSGQVFGRKTAMQKTNNGVWKYTSKSLPADAYTYSFVVDEVKTLDPLNALMKESENGYDNYFVMPGDAAAYCQNVDVPHGSLQEVWFHSDVTDKMTRFHVYTPPGYELMKKKLPVLVLQHGGGDNDGSWSTIGRANFIMDNLYAKKAAQPMVIVMPMGHPTDGFYSSLGLDDDPYYDQLFKEILPLVEKRYRVKNDRYSRAYAGLSMGGMQALNIALFAPEKFGYVLPLSTGFFEPQRKKLVSDYEEVLKNPEINKLKLFWIAMGGEKDIAYENGKALNKIFDQYNIKYQTSTYDAGHTFITWRHNLLEFAPLLFQD
ncbi:esterase [Fulvivirga maritima]|uniref:esterase n=1 Tax=Fulvivirga maritima TaxID=2904247 RepID=UPI001EEB5D72|nr:esterase [Fulvivirga maritima]UII25736.1 esterase [Fulvivirga maritima]